MATTNASRRLSKALATAAAVALVLPLAACSSSDSEEAPGEPSMEDPAPSESSPPTQVYDFESAKTAGSMDESPLIVTGESVVIQLSDELKSAIPDGAGVAVEKFTVTPAAYSTGICRLDVAVEYAAGGFEAVKNNKSEYLEADSVEDAVAKTIAWTGTSSNAVDAVPDDEAIEDGETYVTRDGKNLTIVQSCNESPDETDEFAELNFPYLDQSDPADKVDEFASVSLYAMSGGTVAVTSGRTAAELNPAGSWKKPTD